MENNIDRRYAAGNKYPGPVAAGAIFSLVTILLTYGGKFLAFNNSFLKSGMGEILLILVPVMLFLLAGGYNIRETLKLKATRPFNYLVIVFLMMFGIPVVGVLNAIVLGIIRLIFGKNLPIPPINIPDTPTLFIAILVIGVSAAVCEETLFRGFISKGYRGLGTAASLVVTSVLFGILHRDIQKGVSTILLGALIGFIVYRTGSLYSGMVAHFTNNSIAVLLSYASSGLSKRMNSMGIEQAENFDFSGIPTASMIIVIIFYLILFLGFLAGFIAIFYGFLKSTEGDVRERIFHADMTGHQDRVMPMGSKTGLAGILSLLPGLALILLTFAGQILELMNVNSGIIYGALKSIGLL